MNLLTLIERLNQRRISQHLPALELVRCCSTSNGGEWHFNICPVCGVGNDRFIVQPNRTRMDRGSLRGMGYFACRRSFGGDCSYRDSQGRERRTNGDSIAFACQFLKMHYSEAQKLIASSDWQPEPLTSRSGWQFSVTGHSNNLNAISEDSQNRQCPPPLVWQQAMKRLLDDHAQLSSSTSQWLENRGLPPEACHFYGFGEIVPEQGWIGWHVGHAQLTHLRIGPGLLIPIWGIAPIAQTESQLMAIRKRNMSQNCEELERYGRYQTLRLSASKYMNIVGRNWSLKEQRVLMVTESDLDAYALHYAAKDLVAVAASGSATLPPSNQIKRLGSELTIFLCHDNDNAGRSMFEAWSELVYSEDYSPVFKSLHATPVPVGKDIGEAVGKGLDLRSWVIRLLQNTRR